MTSYSELLSDNRWQNLRLEIIHGDEWKCQNCDNESYIKNYQIGEYISSSVFKVVLHGFPKNMVCKTTYKITFKTQDDELISYVNCFHGLGDRNLLPSDVYFNSVGDLTIQAIKGVKGWEYVRNLHVHHKYYQDEMQPWEYPESALQTLCWECHMNLHSAQTIEWLDKFGRHKGDLTPCSRCGGAGILPQHSNVENGICFKCRGAKYNELILP